MKDLKVTKLAEFLNKDMFFCVIFFVLSLISTRNLLQSNGVIGHNWDAIIPYYPEYFQRTGIISLFIWDDLNIGSPVVANIPTHQLYGLLGLFGLGLNGEFVSKFLIVFVMNVSAISMFYLVKHILSTRCNSTILNKDIIIISSFFSGIIFGFSPFLYNVFIGGSFGQYLTYSLVPGFILFFDKYLQNKNVVYLLISALFLRIISASMQNFVFAIIIVILIAVLNRNKMQNFLKLTKLCILFLFLNFTWIIGIATYTTEITNVQLNVSSESLSALRVSVPSLLQNMMNSGFFDRHFFFKSIPQSFENIWIIASISLVILIFLPLIIIQKFPSSIKKEFYFWTILYLIGITFAAYGKSPAKDLIFFAFNHISAMNLFRSSQNALFLPTFSFSILVGISLYALIHKFNKKKFSILCLFSIILIFIFPFYYHGDIGVKYLERLGPGNHLDQYTYPMDFYEVYKIVSTTNGTFRTLFLPPSSSPLYLKNTYQTSAQGGDPLLMTSPYNIISDGVSDYTPGTKGLVVDNLVPLIIDFNKSKESEAIFYQILSLLNTKYIFLRNDVIPAFGYLNGKWNYENIRMNLDSLNILYKGDYAILYEIPVKYQRPRIYASKKFIMYNKTTENISDILPDISKFNEGGDSLLDFGYLNTFDKSPPYNGSNVMSFENTPVIKIQKVNPTKYIVNLKEAKQPFVLIFLESYQRGWKAYINADKVPCVPAKSYNNIKVTECMQYLRLFDSNDLIRPFKPSVPESSHFLVNGYANGWYIDPKKLDLVGDGEFSLTLYYEPQTYYYIGLIISLTTLLICVLYLTKEKFSRPRYKEKNLKL